MVKIICVVWLVCLFSLVANAQVKIEKESKVMSSDVPSNAVAWVEEVFDQKKE